MIIVDELEMALHPRAQVKLLRYLEAQAVGKSLTIIFSTHSVTLLKSANRRQIIFLDRQSNGEVQSIVGCYPTYAIGNIAADEETLPDCLFYVEDVFARDMVQAFFNKFADEKFEEPTDRPSTKVVPIGGFKAVVDFMNRNRSVVPNYVRQAAILDEDVRSEMIGKWKASSDYYNLNKFTKPDSSIHYLPFTPEVGLMQYIETNLATFEAALKLKFNDNQVRIANIARDFDKNLVGHELRKSAKASAHSLLRYLEDRSQSSEEIVRERLCEVFALESWHIYRADFMKLFGSTV